MNILIRFLTIGLVLYSQINADDVPLKHNAEYGLPKDGLVLTLECKIFPIIRGGQLLRNEVKTILTFKNDSDHKVQYIECQYAASYGHISDLFIIDTSGDEQLMPIPHVVGDDRSGSYVTLQPHSSQIFEYTLSQAEIKNIGKNGLVAMMPFACRLHNMISQRFGRTKSRSVSNYTQISMLALIVLSLIVQINSAAPQVNIPGITAIEVQNRYTTLLKDAGLSFIDLQWGSEVNNVKIAATLLPPKQWYGKRSQNPTLFVSICNQSNETLMVPILDGYLDIFVYGINNGKREFLYPDFLLVLSRTRIPIEPGKIMSFERPLEIGQFNEKRLPMIICVSLKKIEPHKHVTLESKTLDASLINKVLSK